MQNIEVECFCL